MLKKLFTTSFAGAMLILAGCSDSDDNDSSATATEAPTSIYAAASSDARFSTLVAALDTAGLDDDLSDPDGTFTVFAPTDAAFTALLNQLEISAADLLADPDLANILTYHVLTTEVDAATALTVDGGSRTTLAGPDIIVDDLNSTVLINDATVVDADITTDNGIIHVIDTVLLPPKNLLDTLKERGFTTLKAALDTAKPTLPSAPNTILAPTDAAFTAFLKDAGISAGQLLADPDLGTILSNHVIDASVPASTVASLTEATTAAGETYSVNESMGTITIGGIITVTAVNIPFDDGIIHVIDTVVPAPPSTVN